MRIDIITLFPDMFAALQHGIPGQAIKKGLLELFFWNPRDFTIDKHRTVDDRPYGGGPGMVMKVVPLQAAIDAAKSSITGDKAIVSCLSPQGKTLDQAAITQLMQRKRLILVAGRYEGIDERLMGTEIQEEWSIGDFILSGGELAAMCLIDAVTRLLPGALGNAESVIEESFTRGLLDYPHYTRPEEIHGIKVPEVLLNGDHEAIRRWRLKQSLGRTWLKRPDLIEKHSFTDEERLLLAEFIQEYQHEHNHSQS